MEKNKAVSLYDQALREAKKKSPDNDLVFDLLSRALSKGDPNAAYALGTWYLYGKHVKKNMREAVKLLRQASEKNVPDALFDLAICYEKGAGLKKNDRLAFECYLKAALHNDAQSTYETGRCYFYGIGVEKDRRTAKIWFNRAKELGIND